MKMKLINDVFGGLFVYLLTFLFITLKLCNVITWNWLWVFAPIWIPLVASMGILGVILFIGMSILAISMIIIMILTIIERK